MSAISSKAILKTTDPYKYNAGSELEEELNYYNTFYRKYDAQIGRFTGVDILSESTVGLSPFQFGNNNAVMFNDPTGAKFERTLTSSGQSFVALFEHWYETGIENAMDGKYKAYNPENIPDDGGGGGQAGNGFFGSGWGYGDLHNTYFNNGGNDAEVTGVMPTVTIEATRQNNGTLSFGDAQWNWNGGRMGSDGWFSSEGKVESGIGFPTMMQSAMSPDVGGGGSSLLNFIGFRHGFIPEFETSLADGHGAITLGPIVFYPTGGSSRPYYNAHEPGHAMQFWLLQASGLGLAGYFTLVGIPSALSATFDAPNHSNYFWEKSASTLEYWWSGQNDPRTPHY